MHFLAGQNKAVQAWIIGKNYILSAQKRAALRNFSEFRTIVNFEVQVYWFFLKGQFHTDLFTFISVLVASRLHPDILILHLDNDSFGTINTLSFICGVKLELSRIRSLLPNTVLIISEAYPVLAWVHIVFSFRDKIRKRINRILHNFLPINQGFFFSSFEPGRSCPRVF